MLTYDLGEMRAPDGSSLRYEVERRSSGLAIGISDALVSTPAYREVSARLPSDRIDLYFRFLLKKEIYPYARQACVIEWNLRNAREMAGADRSVKVPCGGIFPLMAKCWDFTDVPVIMSGKGFSLQVPMSAMRKRVKEVHARLSGKKAGNGRGRGLRSPGGYMFACHYAEGFDPFRRNDLNWFEGSGISPEKVLIYFDSPDNKDGKPVKKEVIGKLKDAGFGLVAMEEGVIEGGDYCQWRGPAIRKESLLGNEFSASPADDWVREAGNALIASVEYWRSFYRDFNIRINYIPEEGTAKSFAQAIAFDAEGDNGGLLAGKQRSEAFLPYRYYLGYHPKHVFFMWNSRAASRVDPASERIDEIVLSGYPYDAMKSSRTAGYTAPSDELRSRGVKTVIALFDNMHGRDFYLSTAGMSDFYSAFLKWALEDKRVGIIMKSKKSLVIERLPEIRALIDGLSGSGRCIKLDDEWGRYPSDASIGADFAIGAGISTAIIESVLAGCRGIHCDITGLKSYDFYKWGQDRIIFNDIDRMMGALKRYISNPAGERSLGDWSGHVEELDPFHDWKGGERMGQYMRFLLESYDRGRSRRGALDDAGRMYSEKWGKDKVIRMEQTNG
ncbi:MAG: hypothetical protein WC369_03200 [Dehalococcoidales bacterium]|jgi:hypothetical protein